MFTVQLGKLGEGIRTTLRVPTSSLGGETLVSTISEMKLEVMPMIAMRQAACMPLITVKVAPSAPKFGPCMMDCGFVERVP